MCHSPNGLINEKGKLITYNDLPLLKNAAIVLSGHNHAALTPKLLRGIMPQRRGVINPQSEIFPKNMYGIFTNEEMQYLINSGGITKLAKNTGSLHKFNGNFDGELEMIDLIPSKENSLRLTKTSRYN